MQPERLPLPLIAVRLLVCPVTIAYAQRSNGGVCYSALYIFGIRVAAWRVFEKV
jgi:hypothetical protein